MIINTKIKETFQEIATKTIEYGNTPDKERKYLKRLLYIFKKDLTEDEQLFLFKLMIEQLHFRNIITDPDNVVQIHNVKLKTITYVFILSIFFMIVVAALFKVNDSLNGVLSVFQNVIKILAL